MRNLEWNMDDALAARFEEGRNEGINVGIESVALNMFRRGKSLDDIHADTNLSLERIKELANNAQS